MLKTLKKAKLGDLVPIYKSVRAPKDAVEYFARISDYGRQQNSILLESADIVPKYGRFSLGSADPCLRITGNQDEFEILALNDTGKRFLKFIRDDFGFVRNKKITPSKISGKLRASAKSKQSDEQERLKQRTHADILRTIAFKFNPISKPFMAYGGLFGAISYDFIDQFEKLPKNRDDITKDPDYEMYFLDNLFIIDHKKGKMNIIANALITTDDEQKKKEILKECQKKISNYTKSVKKSLPKKGKFEKAEIKTSTDTSKEEYEAIVEKMKEHIVLGDIFQVVPSRTIISTYNNEPLDIYTTLRALNPSPYMFYMNIKSGILLGASPEMALRVEGSGIKRDSEKTVEIRPIAGTKPRGFNTKGEIDPDADSRYETELKIDTKELAEHTMLVDLARNDIAKVSKPGTRVVNEPFVVEKYSHVQHLVSNVSGKLSDDLDALHAYLATMNMGTLTGAPKIEAMKLIRKSEKNKRGFYGGSVGYLTPSGDMDTTIVIRSMQIKGKKAYVRAGAGIVYDSVAPNEFMETEKKTRSCLVAIENASKGKKKASKPSLKKRGGRK
ncbi:anthranilate synthase component 1 [Nanoarchaeota archaeon]